MPAKRVTLPLYTRLLNAWHRTCKEGHCLNPTQFLVLCDLLRQPAEPISSSARARRLHFTQPTTTLALHSLSALGFATLIKTPSPGGYTLTATPTPAAYKLFGLHFPRPLKSHIDSTKPTPAP